MHQFDIIRKTYRNFLSETPSLLFPDKGLVVLLGDNGAGKSMPLKILSGRLRGDRKDKTNARLRSALCSDYEAYPPSYFTPIVSEPLVVIYYS